MAIRNRSLRIGVIGLGDIAQKAYLPVLAARPDLELHLHTRTRATLDRIGDAYRLPHRHDSLDDLLAQDLDAAFVHAPTEAHPRIAERLLEAGVPSYVDKPLAYELADAERLVELAERRGTSLRTLADLRKMGVVTTRAAGFLTLGGRRLQTTRWTQQLGFWGPEEEIGTHHMVYQVSPGTFR